MQITAQEELQLTARLIIGDRQAFDALYHHYHHVVYANIYKYVQQPELAEDILQEVFLAFWAGRDQLNPTRSPGGWLFTVSHNKAISFLRKAVAERKMLSELVSLPIDQDPPDEKTLQWQTDLLNEAINSLPGYKKQVFQLCRLEGKTYNEAAELLNTSPGFIKESLRSASKLVTRYLSSRHPVGELVLLIFFLTANSR
jgi:RNA polymerase sigma factor (sigma-70 family)